MHGTVLSRQDALIESAVARPQQRSAIAGESRSQAETWRHHVPCVQRARAMNDVASLVPEAICGAEILTDGATVVEAYTGVDRQSVADGQGIGRERRRRHKQAAAVRRRRGYGLKRLSGAVDEASAARDDYRLGVLAL